MLVRLFNQDMLHRGFQWKVGLNVIDNFRPEIECGPGLHFCTVEQAHLWCCSSSLIADVKIPTDAETVTLIYKSKANRVIISNVRSIWTMIHIPKIRKVLVNGYAPIPKNYRTMDMLTDRLIADVHRYNKETVLPTTRKQYRRNLMLQFNELDEPSKQKARTYTGNIFAFS